MFHYFGYGSNLSRASLQVKGVESGEAEPARLAGWRLAFNIPHPFRMEGSVANVVPESGAEVHGALCACEDRYLESLDRFEGIGVVYERRALEVRTYRGTVVTAYVYTGIPGYVAAEGRPSRRYHSILVAGANDVGLETGYVRWLENLSLHPPPDYPPFAPPAGCGEALTLADVTERPFHTVLAGHVFDMSDAHAQHATLRDLLDGRDATTFFLRRLHAGSEAAASETRVQGDLSDGQRRYLNECLHEFCHAYRYVGPLA